MNELFSCEIVVTLLEMIDRFKFKYGIPRDYMSQQFDRDTK